MSIQLYEHNQKAYNTALALMNEIGSVDSEITFGEEIVQNVLLFPAYLASMYLYQNDTEKYQQHVKKTKNKTVCDGAQNYLDALCCALT